MSMPSFFGSVADAENNGSTCEKCAHCGNWTLVYPDSYSRTLHGRVFCSRKECETKEYGTKHRETERMTCVAIDPKTGLVVRQATERETVRYRHQPGNVAFFKPVEVDGLLIDEDTGPGMSFAGAGF